MEVNVNGAFHTAQAAARIFKRQGYGNVVFTASVSALLVNTPQLQAAVCVSEIRKITILPVLLGHPQTNVKIQYNASKAGVLQLA